MIQPVNSHKAGLIFEEMKVSEELHEAFVIFDILKFDLFECFYWDLAVSAEHELRLHHSLFRRDKASLVLAFLLYLLLDQRIVSVKGHNLGDLIIEVVKGDCGFSAILGSNQEFHFNLINLKAI